MRNKYFDEPITENDLFYVCYMIEKTSRFLHQRNQYVVNQLGYDHLHHFISVANVNSELCSRIPTELDMGKVYARLIVDTLLPNEDYIQGLIRIYNDAICQVIDDYTNGAYYEPSYVIARAYKNGEF